MTATHLEIKNFHTFQHYHDRNPPWIKLHRTILTDADFLQLPEAAQAQLVKLWLLASQVGHPLPNNVRLLTGQIGTTGRSYIANLIAAGFLIECEQNASTLASTPLADSGNGASSLLANPANGASSALAKRYAYARADARSRESSEFREQRINADDDLAAREFPDLSPVALTVWANRAIAERWGEQPSPLTPGSAADLAGAIANVEADVIRLSIYRQCRESKRTTPPRAVNYFRPGIEDDWQSEIARRSLRDSGEVPPRTQNASTIQAPQTRKQMSEFDEFARLQKQFAGVTEVPNV